MGISSTRVFLDKSEENALSIRNLMKIIGVETGGKQTAGRDRANAMEASHSMMIENSLKWLSSSE